MYRGFIKNITSLGGKALGSADLRIQTMNIKRDILSKAVSEFTVLAIPSAAQEGNVFGVYDDYGKIVYLGVITSISDKTIQTSQIISIFDNNWVWNNPQMATIEETVERILQMDFQGSADSMESDIWSQYSIIVSSATNNFLPSHENNYVCNFMDFIYKLYESYEILFDVNIYYSDFLPTITLYKNTSSPLKLGNNTYALRNFDITRTTEEANKLVIYNSKGTTVRETYYATTSGITTDSTSLNRLPKINTTYVFSDDALADIVAENLPSQMYNHQITCELILKNKLYDFDDFTLGRECDIFYNNEYYNSVLTGYELQMSGEGKAEIVKLIFGKVRYSLDKRLYAERNKDNIATSNYSLKTKELTDFQKGEAYRVGNCSTYTGILANDGKRFQFSICLPRSAAGRTITVTQLNLNARANGGYIAGSGSGYNFLGSGITTSATIDGDDGRYIRIRCDRSTAWGTNNTVVAVIPYTDIILSFS